MSAAADVPVANLRRPAAPETAAPETAAVGAMQ
jgi:hypothetical protein